MLLRAVLYVFLGIFFSSHAYARVPIDSTDSTDENLELKGYDLIKQIVNQNAVTETGQNRYCSGYSCAHFVSDFCNKDRENCRPAITRTHAMSIIRQPVNEKGAEYYCLYEPQFGVELDSQLCWLRDPSKSSEEPWIIPQSIQNAYREQFPNILKTEDDRIKVYDEVFFEIEWTQWWKNQLRADAQLLSICDQQNTLHKGFSLDGPEFDALSSQMPECKTLIETPCKDSDPAEACRMSTPKGRNLCQVLSCKNKSRIFLNWENISLPECNDYKALSKFCGSWKSKLQESQSQDKWEYASNKTRLYCRNSQDSQNINYGVKMFQCDNKGHANLSDFFDPSLLPKRRVSQSKFKNESSSQPTSNQHR